MKSDGVVSLLSILVAAAVPAVAFLTLLLTNFGGRRRVENIKVAQEALDLSVDPIQQAALRLYLDTQSRRLGRLYDTDRLRVRLFPWVAASAICTMVVGFPWAFFPPEPRTVEDSILTILLVTGATTTVAGIYILAIASVPMREAYRVAQAAIRRARRVRLLQNRRL